MVETSDYFLGRLFGARYKRTYKTENQVTVPPALTIFDERGDLWSLGNEYLGGYDDMEFSVLRNDVFMGEYAQKIAFHESKVMIYGKEGCRVWTGKGFAKRLTR